MKSARGFATSKNERGVLEGQRLYHINGIKVQFPVKAYPTQITMMHKILSGLEKRQNCLLESPTGSGKSLSLLCSCLAWQQHEKERIETQNLEEVSELGKEDCDLKDVKPSIKFTEEKLDPTEKEKNQNATIEPESIPLVHKYETTEKDEAKEISVNNGQNTTEGDDEDFQPTKKRYRAPQGTSGQKTKRQKLHNQQLSPLKSDDTLSSPPRWTMEVKSSSNDSFSPEEKEEAAKGKNVEKAGKEEKGKDKEKRRAPPKIFFGTRTHKQIAQIIRELKKTAFKDVRMTVLSSREHTCIHPVVSKSKDKNEECKRLVKGLDGGSCKFHSNASTFSRYYNLSRHGLDQVWDIEDLVAAGRKGKACPYFAARELMKDAEIVFCPYNYLVDPLIRSQMDIVIKDQIVILDEAHNIEDSSRDAASLSVTGVQLNETIDELDKLVLAEVRVDAHRTMHLLCSNLRNWMDGLSSSLQNHGFEQACKTFTGQEMVLNLRDLNITPTTLPLFTEQFSKLLAADLEPNADRSDDLKLGSRSLSLLRGTMLVLGKILNEEKNFANDYHIVVAKSAVMVHKPIHMGGGWRRKSSSMEKVWTFTLNFWCLNPAVVFSEIGSSCRCIVLSSGTLSPMNSFSSELGVRFPIKLEANHVISDSQVWAGALLVGPSNNPINASYRGSETFTFQDDVGQLVLQVCKVMPNGVLCFFPSYSMIEKLSKRWQATGLWKKIEAVKVIVSEPRGSDRTDFDAVLRQFYECVKMESLHGWYSTHLQGLTDKHANLPLAHIPPKMVRIPLAETIFSGQRVDDDYPSLTGALLLAVCRGKVSEGLDFSDENARAVITIGIPFPNTKDTQVELKRKYNSKYAASHGLLNGNEWYEIQAYRALNQALGRCIRHKSDWGALLLVDERFGKSEKYVQGLSKWVRNRVQKFMDFQVCLSSLDDFAKSRQKAASDFETDGSSVIMEPSLLHHTTTDTSSHNNGENLINAPSNVVCENQTENSSCSHFFDRFRRGSPGKRLNIRDIDGGKPLVASDTDHEEKQPFDLIANVKRTSSKSPPSEEKGGLKSDSDVFTERTVSSCDLPAFTLPSRHGASTHTPGKGQSKVTSSSAGCCGSFASAKENLEPDNVKHRSTPLHSIIKNNTKMAKKYNFVYPKGSGFAKEGLVATEGKDRSRFAFTSTMSHLDGMNSTVNRNDSDNFEGADLPESNCSGKDHVSTKLTKGLAISLQEDKQLQPVETDESPLLFPVSPDIETCSEKIAPERGIVTVTADSGQIESNITCNKSHITSERKKDSCDSLTSSFSFTTNNSILNKSESKVTGISPGASKKPVLDANISSAKDGSEYPVIRKKRHSSSRRSNVRHAGKSREDSSALLTDINDGCQKDLVNPKQILVCCYCETPVISCHANWTKFHSNDPLKIGSHGEDYITDVDSIEHLTDMKVKSYFSFDGASRYLEFNGLCSASCDEVYVPLVCGICAERDCQNLIAYKIMKMHNHKDDVSADGNSSKVILLGASVKFVTL